MKDEVLWLRIFPANPCLRNKMYCIVLRILAQYNAFLQMKMQLSASVEISFFIVLFFLCVVPYKISMMSASGFANSFAQNERLSSNETPQLETIRGTEVRIKINQISCFGATSIQYQSYLESLNKSAF